VKSKDEGTISPRKLKLRETTMNRMYKMLNIKDEIDHGKSRVRSKQDLFEFCKSEGLLRKIMALFPFDMFNSDIAEQIVAGESTQSSSAGTAVGGTMKEQVVNMLWDYFDKDNDGVVDLEDVKEGLAIFFYGWS